MLGIAWIVQVTSQSSLEATRGRFLTRPLEGRFLRSLKGVGSFLAMVSASHAVSNLSRAKEKLSYPPEDAVSVLSICKEEEEEAPCKMSHRESAGLAFRGRSNSHAPRTSAMQTQTQTKSGVGTRARHMLSRRPASDARLGPAWRAPRVHIGARRVVTGLLWPSKAGGVGGWGGSAARRSQTLLSQRKENKTKQTPQQPAGNKTRVTAGVTLSFPQLTDHQVWLATLWALVSLFPSEGWPAFKDAREGHTSAQRNQPPRGGTAKAQPQLAPFLFVTAKAMWRSERGSSVPVFGDGFPWLPPSHARANRGTSPAA